MVKSPRRCPATKVAGWAGAKSHGRLVLVTESRRDFAPAKPATLVAGRLRRYQASTSINLFNRVISPDSSPPIRPPRKMSGTLGTSSVRDTFVLAPSREGTSTIASTARGSPSIANATMLSGSRRASRSATVLRLPRKFASARHSPPSCAPSGPETMRDMELIKAGAFLGSET